MERARLLPLPPPKHIAEPPKRDYGAEMEGLKNGKWKTARWVVRWGIDREVSILKYKNGLVTIFYDGCKQAVSPLDLKEYKE